MTAHDILTLSALPSAIGVGTPEAAKVGEATPAFLLLPWLTRSPDATVEVTDRAGDTVGVVDVPAMLRALDEMLGGGSGDSSWVEVSVDATHYSASAVARAVEDVDANLLDMLTSVDPDDPRRMLISLKVSHADPGAVVRSLERYGYEVRSAAGVSDTDYDKARRNLSELELYLKM